MFEKQGVDRFLISNNHVIHGQPLIVMEKKKKKKSDHVEQGWKSKTVLNDIIDLSGLSLDSLSNSTLNLSTITNLNLSNNNLQVSLYINNTLA